MLGNNTGVLIDEFDFSVSSFSGADIERSAPEKDRTAFGDTGVVSEPGMPSGKISVRGYYTGNDAGEVYKELTDRVGVAGAGAIMAVLLDTTDANCVAYCSDNAWQQTLKLALPTDDIITFEAGTAGTEAIECGYRILNTTVTGTGNQAAVDFGAAGAAGGAVFIFVQAVGGTVNNASIKVQSSATQGGTYLDEATVDVDAIGGYAAAMAGAVNRWLRVNIASMGGASSLTLVVIACVKGVTY
jgi:hypothetical protein